LKPRRKNERAIKKGCSELITQPQDAIDNPQSESRAVAKTEFQCGRTRGKGNRSALLSRSDRIACVYVKWTAIGSLSDRRFPRFVRVMPAHEDNNRASTKAVFTGDCAFAAESLEVLRPSFVELKILPTAPDMAKLYTTELLPKR
jgi:hypothetical protein